MAGTLMTGATIWAGPTCTPQPGWLLVTGDRITATGAHDTPPPPADTMIDVAGCHILPGFVDTHLHATVVGWQTLGVDGSAWTSLPAALAAIGAAAAADPHAPWLLVWNARPFRWPQRRLPTAAELDAVAPGRQILVSGVDVHRGTVSSQAMRALGITTRRAQDGDVSLDRRGRPTGEIWEQAYGEALARALASAPGDPVALTRRALDRCVSLGITHAHEAYVPPQHHERMLGLAAPGSPRLSWAVGAGEGLLSPLEGPSVAPDGDYGASGREAKLFLDGGDRCAVCMPARALGRLTWQAVKETVAARHPGPLRDAMRRRTTVQGRTLRLEYLRYSDRELADLLSAYLSAGLRPRMHALGNLAVRQAATALRAVGAPAGAAVIDHLVLLDPAAVDLVAASGAWATVQPGFLTTFGPQIVDGGTDRFLTVVGGRSLLDAGVPLTLASDHPAGPLDPLGNLRLAVRRPIQPAQALTPAEAVRALTVTAAASLGAPGAGGLAAGETADLAICDGDPFDPATRVTQTWISGRRVWPAAATG
ncbi:amidohydrolase family protein [Dactylosporangium sp. CA-152071]|uniref:amidohydrolase family protein n=1 Tax=Dactylosporangium sp. CA-152071 TaxID=3239933 RepID=UPI003D8B97E8